MGTCFSRPKRTHDDQPKKASVVEDEASSEHETDLEIQSDEDEEISGRSTGWDQYHTWARGHLLEKWSNEAEERRRLGLPPKEEIDCETLTEMIMFGLASKGLRS